MVSAKRYRRPEVAYFWDASRALARHIRVASDVDMGLLRIIAKIFAIISELDITLHVERVRRIANEYGRHLYVGVLEEKRKQERGKEKQVPGPVHW